MGGGHALNFQLLIVILVLSSRTIVSFFSTVVLDCESSHFCSSTLLELELYDRSFFVSSILIPHTLKFTK